MKKQRKFKFLILGLFLLASCSGPSIYVMPYKSDLKIDVYTTGKPIRMYTELGFIAIENVGYDASKYSDRDGYASFNPFEEVKKQAQKLGADAIIIVNPDSIIVGSGKWVEAIAIKYN